MAAMASSLRPAASLRRMLPAEGYSPPSPSWLAPSRRMGRGVTVLFSRRRALQYSTARMSLGWESTAAPSVPRMPSSARCRAAAKLTGPESSPRSRREKSPESSASAAFRTASPSPLSLPKIRWVTRPVPVSTSTPPCAKRSAGAAAQESGSSSTRSAPERTAASARACLGSRAKSPRWTKFPLMAQTTAVSAPRSSRTRRSWRRCPPCRGLYSAMIPAMATEFPPIR